MVNDRSMSNEPIYAEIGARLIALREGYCDLSQKEWAVKNGFNVGQYGSWERGTRRVPVEAAERLCDRYGLTLDFIYRGRLEGLSETARKMLSFA